MISAPRRSYARVILPRVEKAWWERGARYAREGRVGEIVPERHGFRARVRGTKAYEVRVAWYGSGISTHCTCPIGGPKAVCKHVIALSIIADETNGLASPTNEEVENGTIPPPLVSRAQIDAMYDTPLNADLEVLRLASSESGSWSRPHARLPQRPAMPAGDGTAGDLKVAPTQTAVEQAFQEIRRWARRSSFDPYFCAGEMMAAFCEVLRLCRKTWADTPVETAAAILERAVAFETEMLAEMIDSSDGVQVFGAAHILTLLEELRERPNLPAGIPERLSRLDPPLADWLLIAEA